MSYNTILATAPLTTQNYHLKMIGTSIGNSLIWDNGTNVGIGTTSPNAPLNVVKDDGVSAGLHILADFNRNTSSAELILGYNADGTNVTTNTIYSANSLPLAFHTSAIERMRITASGNVGIGVTSPSYQLDVYAASGYTARLNGATYGGLILANAGTANSYFVGESTLLSIEHIAAINLRTNNADRVRITSGGLVGIGTSSPTRNLVVQNSSTESLISIVSNTASIAYLLFGDTAADAQGRVQYNNASDIIQIFTNGAEAIRILSNQNVGIGTGGDANYRVYIKGVDSGTSNSAFLVQNNADGLMFSIRNDGFISTGTRSGSPYNLPTTGRNAVIESNGGLGYTTSTRESKTNINSITNINWINQLNPVSFNYRKKDNELNFTEEYYEEKSYGFIADEVEQVNPDFVFYDIKEDGTKKLAGVEYNNMIAILTKALQEQQIQIQNLQEQINILAK